MFGGKPAAPVVEASKIEADLDDNGVFEDLESRLAGARADERLGVLVKLSARRRPSE